MQPVFELLNSNGAARRGRLTAGRVSFETAPEWAPHRGLPQARPATGSKGDDETVLEARQVSKHYGPVRALIEVEFAIGTGEIVALAGENGSGKSTLAKVLAGALAADAGSVVLDGEPCVFGRPRDALNAGIALVTQEPTACPALRSYSRRASSTSSWSSRARPSSTA